MDKLKERWENLAPNVKRLIMFGGIVLALFLASKLLPDNKALRTEATPKRPANALISNGTEQADWTVVNAKVDAMRKDQADQRDAFTQLSKELQRVRDASNGDRSIKDNALGVHVEDRLMELSKEIDDLKRKRAEDASRSISGSGSETVSDETTSFLDDPLRHEKHAIDTAKPLSERTPTDPSRAGATVPQAVVGLRRVAFSIDDQLNNSVSSSPGDAAATKGSARPNSTERNAITEQASQAPIDVFLPPGTLMTGFLLNGVYLPALASANGEGVENPHPVQIRVAGEARLPNGGTVDLTDCIVFASGWAEMSTERGHFRTINLTCARGENYLSGKLHAYLSGEDAIEGLNGPIVEKTGQALMRAGLAGIASGIADAAKPQQVTSIQTGPSAGGVGYSSPNLHDASRVGMYSGAGKAMDRMAAYYLKRAADIFPTIEISAMREISIHVEEPVRLRPVEQLALEKKTNG